MTNKRAIKSLEEGEPKKRGVGVQEKLGRERKKERDRQAGAVSDHVSKPKCAL